MKRIAIVDTDRCTPSKCKRECERFCPVNAQQKQCITHNSNVIKGKSTSKAEISEILCTGCNICVKKCPFGAISIVNLPSALGHVTHRHGLNGFQLYGLPMPEKNSVLGLVGNNGCGKTTAILILIGKLVPNLGDVNKCGKNRRALNIRYRGTNIQNYLTELDSGLRIGYKPQNIQCLRKLEKKIREIIKPDILHKLELDTLADRDCQNLSDGELQRVFIGITLSEDVDVLVFDEPCTYLDIHQRMLISRMIRESSIPYKMVIEHDFTALDYMADKVCLLYGVPGAYGNITLSMTVSEGLNCFLDGYITYSNTRFRSNNLDFIFSGSKDDIIYESQTDNKKGIHYPSFSVSLGKFKLIAESGYIPLSSLTVLLGKNGSGKTTFIKSLCGNIPTSNGNLDIGMKFGYKTQDVYSDSSETVYEYLTKVASICNDMNFKHDVIDPLCVEHLMNRKMSTLSGGEMQKIAIIATLGQNNDIYLIDEPSCYLDIESVLVLAKVLKRFALNNNKSLFVVEHDFILGLYLADQVLLFNDGIVSKPMSNVDGFNTFLSDLNITMRRDHTTSRPRINKPGSRSDTEQKKAQNFISAIKEHVQITNKDIVQTSFEVKDISW